MGWIQEYQFVDAENSLKLDRASLRCDDACQTRHKVITHVLEVFPLKGLPLLISSSLHNLDVGVGQSTHALHQVAPEGVVLK